jgi:hypothetical protein
MTLSEVIPLIESLPNADKFKLMNFMMAQFSKEKIAPFEIQNSKDDALWEIVGMAEGEEADIARNHDEYLYGTK